MKIFFTGAHGSGKTTLVNEISKWLPDYKTATSLTSKFITSIKDQLVSSPNFMNFQSKISLNMLYNCVIEDNIISDRSIIDSVVYIKYAINNTSDKETIKKLKLLLKMVDFYKEYFKENVVVFYTPVEVDIDNIDNKNNPNRIKDKKYQEEIEKLFKKEIKKWKKEIKYFYVIKGDTIEKRTKKIKKILKDINILK